MASFNFRLIGVPLFYIVTIQEFHPTYSHYPESLRVIYV